MTRGPELRSLVILVTPADLLEDIDVEDIEDMLGIPRIPSISSTSFC